MNLALSDNMAWRIEAGGGQRYRVLERIAKGNECTVYKVEAKDGTILAIKVPSYRLGDFNGAAKDASQIERFKKILDDYGVPYLPTDIIQDVQLTQPNGSVETFPYAQVQPYIEEPAFGLERLHDGGVRAEVEKLLRAMNLMHQDGYGLDLLGAEAAEDVFRLVSAYGKRRLGRNYAPFPLPKISNLRWMPDPRDGEVKLLTLDLGVFMPNEHHGFFEASRASVLDGIIVYQMHVLKCALESKGSTLDLTLPAQGSHWPAATAGRVTSRMVLWFEREAVRLAVEPFDNLAAK